MDKEQYNDRPVWLRNFSLEIRHTSGKILYDSTNPQFDNTEIGFPEGNITEIVNIAPSPDAIRSYPINGSRTRVGISPMLVGKGISKKSVAIFVEVGDAF